MMYPATLSVYKVQCATIKVIREIMSCGILQILSITSCLVQSQTRETLIISRSSSSRNVQTAANMLNEQMVGNRNVKQPTFNSVGSAK